MSEWIPIVGRSFTAFDFLMYVDQLSFSAWKPSLVVVHNTASPKFADWHAVDGASRMRGLQKYYQEQGWHAGPHLFVSDDLIWAFTPLTSPGVHSPSWNAISWGVETTGDWDSEIVPTELYENLIAVLAAIHRAAGLDPETALKFHHEDPLTTHKSCPGANLRKDDLVTRVKAMMGPIDFDKTPT